MLLAKMRENPDFLSFGETVSRLMILTDNDEGFTKLAQAILCDAALTQRVLRLANAALYKVTSERVTSVYKALIYLGLDAVRSIAISMVLLEATDGLFSWPHLKKDLSVSLWTAAAAKSLARSWGANAELAEIGSLFRGAGRVLLAAYESDAYRQVRATAAALDIAESVACRKRFGIGFDHIAHLAVREWGLPEAVIRVTEPLGDKAVNSVATEGLERLAVSLAGEAAEALMESRSLEGIALRYRALELTGRKIGNHMASALDEASTLIRAAGLPMDLIAGAEREPPAEPAADRTYAGNPQTTLAHALKDFSAALATGKPLAALIEIALAGLSAGLSLNNMSFCRLEDSGRLRVLGSTTGKGPPEMVRNLLAADGGPFKTNVAGTLVFVLPATKAVPPDTFFYGERLKTMGMPDTALVDLAETFGSQMALALRLADDD